MKHLTILGATGSIGKSTLNVVRHNPNDFRVFALCAFRNAPLLAQQIDEFAPPFAAIATETLAKEVYKNLKKPASTQILWGEEALSILATHPETEGVVAAIVGAAGLKPTIAAAQCGKSIFLANKEVLVMAGALFCEAVQKYHARIFPVDSEHNAIFQSLPQDFRCCCDPFPAEKILLTASGGAFLHKNWEELKKVTPQEASSHPNWQMGQKVTVDSASLMNKGLEVIEAFWLFSCKTTQIEVLIHPQSIVHSGVHFKDGSFIAEMGNPNMQTPIAHALAQSLSPPKRLHSGVAPLNLCQMSPLEFFPPDTARFPNLSLAFEALKMGGTAPAVLNAANEVAVDLFLKGRILFTDIPRINRFVLEKIKVEALHHLEQIFEVDHLARQEAKDFVIQNPR